jgi:hypothetical protein
VNDPFVDYFSILEESKDGSVARGVMGKKPGGSMSAAKGVRANKLSKSEEEQI